MDPDDVRPHLILLRVLPTRRDSAGNLNLPA